MIKVNDKELKKQLERHEGRRLKPYRCPAGFQTIGVGHNLDANGISDFVCDYIYLEDTAIAIDAVRDIFPPFDELSDARQRVLIDMCFNLGKSKLAGFRKMFARLHDALQTGDYVPVADEMLDSKWAREDVQQSRSTTLTDMMIKG